MDNTITLPVSGINASSGDHPEDLEFGLTAIQGSSSTRRSSSFSTGADRKTELVVSHTNTKENGTVTTRRSTFRINQYFTDSVTGKPCVAATQIVIVAPESAQHNPQSSLLTLLGILKDGVTATDTLSLSNFAQDFALGEI